MNKLELQNYIKQNWEDVKLRHRIFEFWATKYYEFEFATSLKELFTSLSEETLLEVISNTEEIFIVEGHDCFVLDDTGLTSYQSYDMYDTVVDMIESLDDEGFANFNMFLTNKTILNDIVEKK